MVARWLFIWATGRSGSTTLLEMINAVPCIGLSGENGQFMHQIAMLNRTTHSLNGKKGSWFNNVDWDMVKHSQQSWISSLNAAKKNISGFKEIRIDSMPFIIKLFPGASHVVNYRRNHTLQLKSQFQTKTTDAALFLKEATIRKHLQGQRVFELALEDFSVNKLNRLLSWIGIDKYRFTDVIHSNNKGYNSDGRRVCTTQCSC